MKLLTYAADDGPRCGIAVTGRVIDVARLLDDGRPVADVAALLRRGDALARLAQPAEADHPADDRALEDLRLLPPILRPPTIRDHIAFEEHATRQFTRPVAEVWGRRPIHYYSNTSRLVGQAGNVQMPVTERLDYELELAVVIKDECSDLQEEEVWDHVLGFTILNDWSARDLQADEMSYGLGPAKGKDFATSLGPWIVTLDELEDKLVDGVLDLDCRVRVNGEVWAESNSRAQHHSWAAMLAHASQDSVLLPGDVIASGTVGGCSIGEAIRKGYPAHYLRPGDWVELEVERLGTLANTITPSQHAANAHVYRAPELPPMPVPIQANGSASSEPREVIRP